MTWLGLLVDALVSLVYRTNREQERLERDREAARIQAIEESDARLRADLEKLRREL